MRPRRRLTKYRANPPGGYFGLTAFEDDRRLGRIDWCRGFFHVNIEGVGHIGYYGSESSAKSALRRFVRQRAGAGGG